MVQGARYAVGSQEGAAAAPHLGGVLVGALQVPHVLEQHLDGQHLHTPHRVAASASVAAATAAAQ